MAGEDNNQLDSELENIKLKRLHGWQYFEYHANQRLVLFRFYITIFTVTSGVTVLLLKEYPTPGVFYESLGLILGIVLSIVTFIFKGLDKRNRQLIHYAEDSIKEFEKKYFEQDADKSKYSVFKSKYSVFTIESLNKPCFFRHTPLLNCVFILGGLLSFLIIVYSFYYLVCHK